MRRPPASFFGNHHNWLSPLFSPENLFTTQDPEEPYFADLTGKTVEMSSSGCYQMSNVPELFTFMDFHRSDGIVNS